MDICMGYIKEANDYINKIQEIPLYESVFFEKKKIEEIEKDNQEATEKSVSLLKRACDFIASLYSKLKTAIQNFLDFKHLSKDQQEEFKKFEEECKKNPEFANKKITVKNWKEIEKAYDEVLQKAEEELKRCMKEKEEARPSISAWLKKKASSIGSIGKNAMVEITIKEAIRRAKKSPEEARAMLLLIDNDTVINEQIRKELGDRQTNKTVKQLRRLSSDSALLRWIGGFRKRKKDEQGDYHESLITQIRDCYKIYHRVEKNNPDLKKSKKTVMGVGKDVLIQTYRNKKALKAEARDARNRRKEEYKRYEDGE